MTQSVLIVTTSTGRAGEDGPETGFDWTSLAVPYWRLREAGIRVGFASVRGGKPPGDERTAGSPRSGAVEMFLGDARAVEGLATSLALADVDPDAWDALLVTDGIGGLWDLADSEVLAELLLHLRGDDGLVAAIGAGTVALTSVRDPENGALVAGRRMTCPHDDDLTEAAGGVEPPALPEARLRALGALLVQAPEDETPEVVEDGRLITGQDARASADVALQLLDALDVQAATSGRRHAPDDPAGTILDPDTPAQDV